MVLVVVPHDKEYDHHLINMREHGDAMAEKMTGNSNARARDYKSIFLQLHRDNGTQVSYVVWLLHMMLNPELGATLLSKLPC